MADVLDDFTAAEIGHALVRYLVDEDPAGVGRFIPDLDPAAVDDAKAARIAHSLVELLRNVGVA
ncbi:MAG TPA: hypothetical protein VMU20_11750 [Candidatus Dormibacteraeota bacterium]|jgi:hypothetical protein|nr:hypothetical protein [Candidatus Dormibacteraeota bacterium]